MRLSCVDQRPQGAGVIHSITHFERLYFTADFLNKHIKYFFLDQKTICTDTCLKTRARILNTVILNRNVIHQNVGTQEKMYKINAKKKKKTLTSQNVHFEYRVVFVI
jgi:hypothetical protein